LVCCPDGTIQFNEPSCDQTAWQIHMNWDGTTICCNPSTPTYTVTTHACTSGGAGN
jgi:hypothetical protein